MQKVNIRLLGVIVIIFSAIHLLLNLYIIILPLILKPDELQKLMQMLSQMFGPIAIQQNRNGVVLSIKVITSALFLSSGIGIIKYKEWSRKLLLCLCGLRVIYGLTICVIFSLFHPHFAIILAVGLFLFYYLTRSKVKEQFK